MRTITIEEHFLANDFRESMNKNTHGGSTSISGTDTELQAKLADLGSIRLQDMDAGNIDLQVISHTASGIQSLSTQEVSD